jgi:creatinine amidohydrolase
VEVGVARPTLFEELDRESLAALAGEGLLVWPVGATEQHGPHLPVGTDAMHAEWVAHAAVERLGGVVPIVVAPTLRIGSSAHHVPFGGTLSFTTWTYYRAVREAVEALIGGGFRRLFILNGHGGNHELIALVARDVALERSDVHIAAGSWWAMARAELTAAGAADAGRFPGHAGRFETSLVLAMRPELVRGPLPHREPGTAVGRSGNDLRAEHSGFWQAIEGFTDSPDLAEAELGRRWLEVAAQVVARAFESFYRESRGEGA